MWYMDYFYSEDLDYVCYVDKKNNNVVIKFFGFPDRQSSQLFTSYVMATLGFNYIIEEELISTMIH